MEKFLILLKELTELEEVDPLEIYQLIVSLLDQQPPE
jgi:hypothetical protein